VLNHLVDQVKISGIYISPSISRINGQLVDRSLREFTFSLRQRGS
jgi:hypothetical protein